MKRFVIILGLIACLAGARAHALTLTEGSAWRETRIPVCWETVDPAHKQERALVRKAVRLSWEAESAVRFTGWRACKRHSDGIRIQTETGYPRTRARGRFVDGLARGMILPELWGLTAFAINLTAPVHEFGHALGFGHEHARADATNGDICRARGSDGNVYVENDLALTPFDDDSVMVACIATASRNLSAGLPRLSAADIFGLVRAYGSHPDNILDRDERGDRFGAAILLADLNLDGQPDLAVGAPGEDDGIGAVYLYVGDRRRGFRPMSVLRAIGSETSPIRGFGAELRWIPSTGDGPGRLGIGTKDGAQMHLYRPIKRRKPVADTVIAMETTTHGTEMLFSGPIDQPDLTAFDFPSLQDIPDSEIVVLHADLNHDGAEDVIVGAPTSNGSAPESGTITVLRGYLEAGQLRHKPWYWFGQAY